MSSRTYRWSVPPNRFRLRQADFPTVTTTPASRVKNVTRRSASPMSTARTRSAREVWKERAPAAGTAVPLPAVGGRLHGDVAHPVPQTEARPDEARHHGDVALLRGSEAAHPDGLDVHHADHPAPLFEDRVAEHGLVPFLPGYGEVAVPRVGGRVGYRDGLSGLGCRPRDPLPDSQPDLSHRLLGQTVGGGEDKLPPPVEVDGADLHAHPGGDLPGDLVERLRLRDLLAHEAGDFIQGNELEPLVVVSRDFEHDVPARAETDLREHVPFLVRVTARRHPGQRGAVPETAGADPVDVVDPRALPLHRLAAFPAKVHRPVQPLPPRRRALIRRMTPSGPARAPRTAG